MQTGFLIGVLVCTCEASCLASATLALVENGRSAYRIVLNPQATDIDRRAAEELRKYIGEVTGARLPVIKATSVTEGPLVWILSAGHAGSFRESRLPGVQGPLHPGQGRQHENLSLVAQRGRRPGVGIRRRDHCGVAEGYTLELSPRPAGTLLAYVKGPQNI